MRVMGWAWWWRHQALRKSLLAQAADSALHDVRVWLDKRMTSADITQRSQQGSEYNKGEHFEGMFRSIEEKCAAEVKTMKDRPFDYYNNDAKYQLAYVDGAVASAWRSVRASDTLRGCICCASRAATKRSPT
jgi:hypothetical protein